MSTANDINVRIAEIFGIDVDNVFEMTIELRVDSVPVITTRSWLREAPGAEVTQRFRVVPIEEGEIEVTSLSDIDKKFVKVSR